MNFFTRNRTNLIVGGVAAVALIVAGNLLIDVDTIPSDQRAVVRSFGVVQPKAAQPGLHIHPSWHKYEPVSMAFTELLFADSEGANDNAINYVSGDGFENAIAVSVSWAVNEKHLTYVKARQPGYFQDRELTIVRTAVRTVASKLSYADGTLLNRELFEQMLRAEIIKRTTDTYLAMGYGDRSSEIIDYGLVSIRSHTQPGGIAAKIIKVEEAKLEAAAKAEITRVPAGRSVSEYTAVLKARAIAEAAEQGNVSVTVVDGNNPVATIVKSK